jgi:hypothetical protein
VQLFLDLGNQVFAVKDATVGEEVKRFLPLVIDHAASRRLLIFDIRWHNTRLLEQSPLVNVPRGVSEVISIGLGL